MDSTHRSHHLGRLPGNRPAYRAWYRHWIGLLTGYLIENKSRGEACGHHLRGLRGKLVGSIARGPLGQKAGIRDPSAILRWVHCKLRPRRTWVLSRPGCPRWMPSHGYNRHCDPRCRHLPSLTAGPRRRRPDGRSDPRFHSADGVASAGGVSSLGGVSSAGGVAGIKLMPINRLRYTATCSVGES